MAGNPGTRKGNGAGWGGPAKGPGKSGPGSGAGRKPRHIEIAENATKAERLAVLQAKLEDLALNAATEQVQLAATQAAMNRLEGTPVSRSAKVDPNDFSKLSNEEIRERLAHLDRVRAEVARGGSPEADPSKPTGLVN